MRVLEQLVGTAIIDPRFREDLLNGRRREVIADFDLTAEEKAMILGIHAHTLQEFAAVLDRWLNEPDIADAYCPAVSGAAWIGAPQAR
jgi:hypothetical protein